MGAPLSFDRFHATVMVVAVIAVCPGGVGRAGFAGTVCTTFDVRLNIPHPFFDCARTRNCRGWQLHGSPLMVAVRLKCRTELASVCHRCLYCTLCTSNHPSITVCMGSVYEAQYEVGVRPQCEEMHISVSQYTCLATMVQRILYVVAALPLPIRMRSRVCDIVPLLFHFLTFSYAIICSWPFFTVALPRSNAKTTDDASLHCTSYEEISKWSSS